jgi:nucleotide-binding universal stress UspA family protein
VIPHTILYGRLRSGYQIPTDIRNQIIGGIEDNARKAIDDAYAFLTKNGVVTNTTMPKFSDVADSILRTAKRGYDLIIMGGRGEEVKDPYGVGSVTKKVIRHSKKPTLIIKKSSSLSKMLVCLDGSRHSINALNFAVKIGELMDSNITLINVQDRHLRELSPESAEKLGQFILSRAVDKIMKTNLKIDKKVAFGVPPDTIIEVAEREAQDLVVLSSIGHNTISQLLLGSVADDVISKAKCSVLVVPPKK